MATPIKRDVSLRIKSVTSIEAMGQPADDFTFVYTVGGQAVTRIVEFSVNGGLGYAAWFRVYRKVDDHESIWHELNRLHCSDVEYFDPAESAA